MARCVNCLENFTGDRIFFLFCPICPTLTFTFWFLLGYLRLATAYAGLEREVEAVEALTIGANNTKHATLLQKLKDIRSQPISELLRTKPNSDPIMIQSPLNAGAIRQTAKRLRSCTALFQGMFMSSFPHNIIVLHSFMPSNALL